MSHLIERVLHGTTGNIELRRMVWNPNAKDGKGKYGSPTERLFTRDLRKIEDFIKNGAGDVFHGTATRKPDAETGTKDDVDEIVCLTVDVDFKVTPQEDLEKTLQEFPCVPTLIVDSGNGRHLYWFLKAPILLNGDAGKVEIVEAINRGLGRIFSGDHTHNIDRILRSPGRENSKWPDRPLCKIMSFDGPEYDLEDLMVYAEDGGSPSGRKINLGEVPDKLPQKFKELLATNRVIKATWKGERPDINDQTGSGYDMAMASILARFGFTAEEIAGFLRAMPSGKGKEATQQYLELTIGKAFASMKDSDETADSDQAEDESASEEDAEKVKVNENAKADRQTEWPHLADDALYGLLGDIVKAIEPYTEADPVAVLGNMTCGFGNAIGRGPYFRVEETNHYTNEYIVTVGETAKARKGQSWSTPRKILTAVEPEWAPRITSGLSSGEGLIYNVRDELVKQKAYREKGEIVYQDVIEDAGVEDKRLLVVEQEFSQPLKMMSREGNILSVTLRDAWDGNDLHPLTKNNPIRATNPHISVIGHITKPELLRHLTETEMANGFGNRIIWLLVRRSKYLPESNGVPDHIINPFIEKLNDAVRLARNRGLIPLDEEAKEIWAEIYRELSAGRPGLTGAMLARSEPHTRRVALIYALADSSDRVRTEHLKAALALWDYAEESVRLIFGNKTGDPLADRIYSIVKDAGGKADKLTVIDLLSRNYSKDRFDLAIHTLVEAGLICEEKVGHDGKGRPRIILKAIR